jgi:hypothetical protein
MAKPFRFLREKMVRMAEETSESVSNKSAEIQSPIATIAPTTTIAVIPVGTPVPPPTLHTAFYTFCQALEASLTNEEDAELLAHAGNIQGWHDNGNVVIAWQHAVKLLEHVLGAPMG